MEATATVLRQSHIAFRVRGCHKSIRDVEWLDVPPLVVLTGVNGAGKTQLLEALYAGLSGDRSQGAVPREVEVAVQGEDFGAGDVLLQLGLGEPGNARHMTPADFGRVGSDLHQVLTRNRADPDNVVYRETLIRDLGPEAGRLDADALASRVSEEPSLLFRPQRPMEGLGQIFVRYRVAMFDAFTEGVKHEDIEQHLGTPPWVLLNRILGNAGFPYRVNSPGNLKFAERYMLQFEAGDGQPQLNAMDLSSGERAFLTLVLWLYGSRELGTFPRLLLLDEPDAFLHPSLAGRFLDVVSNVLVDELGIRVILTTHSPSTVAQAPVESLFEVRKAEPRVRRCTDRWAAVNMLTDGLVAVGPSTRIMFVEDESDRDFFSATFDGLSRLNFEDERPELSHASPPLFVPASLGSQSGGRDRVIAWVSTLEGSHVGGIVDGDAMEGPLPARVLRLGRYEHENYLVDPLVVFAWLSEKKAAPQLDGVQVRFGEERLLAQQPAEALQRIVDHVLDLLLPAADRHLLDDVDRDKTVEVPLVTGQVLRYPEWFLQTKGKRLLGPLQSLFDKRMDWVSLRLVWEKVGLFPAELEGLMRQAR